MLFAQEGQRILIAALALDLTGVGQEQPRLAHQVERGVREAEVLLERRRMADPLAQPLGEDQARIREPQHVAQPWRRLRSTRRSRRRRCRAHSVFTSSGMS